MINKQAEETDKIIEFNGQKIHTSIFTQGFVPGCDMKICGGQCCDCGVYMDKDFRNVILEHKEVIKEVMSPQQIKDESQWFDEEIIEDDDFPSGYAAGSNVFVDNIDREKCVFMDDNHYCSLQVAAMKMGLHKWAIKPTHCILYPVTLMGGVIMFDDEHSDNLLYCGIHEKQNFSQSVLEGTQEEIEYVFGEEMLNFLNDYYKKNFAPKYSIETAQKVDRRIYPNPENSSEPEVHNKLGEQ